MFVCHLHYEDYRGYFDAQEKVIIQTKNLELIYETFCRIIIAYAFSVGFEEFPSRGL